MAEEREFQQQLQEIVGLVHDLETIADPASRGSAQKLVQVLMDLHAKAFERSLEIIFGSARAGSRKRRRSSSSTSAKTSRSTARTTNTRKRQAASCVYSRKT